LNLVSRRRWFDACSKRDDEPHSEETMTSTRLLDLLVCGSVLGALAGCSGSVSAPVSVSSAFASAGSIVGLAGKCLDDNADGTGNGNKVQLWQCNGTDAQRWTYQAGAFVGPGGKCLDVTGGNATSGTAVQLYACNGTAAQQWTVDGDRIVGIGGKCLDVRASGTADGTQIQIWDCNGTAAQQWTVGGGGASPSPSGTTIPPAAQIVDDGGNVWTVAGGVIDENGAPAGYSANVTLLLFQGGTIYQQNSTGGWWSWNGSGWSDATDPRGGGNGGSGGGSGGGGSFTVSSGGFRDPNGNAWTMRGLNAGVQDALDGFGNVLSDYPGLTAIRLNCDPDNDSLAAIDQVVQEYTGRGVVVEVEDHADSAGGDNVGWYQQMAQKYQGNARVFLEVPNEPSASDTAQSQIAIINAIRGAGFGNPIGLQPIGGYDFSNFSTVLGAVGTTQIYATPHIYYGGSDPNGPANYVDGDLQTVQGYGLYACIDEFGDALDGWHRDPYGANVITSVIAATQSGRAGGIFWAMDNGNHPDGADSAFSTRDGSQLTSVGVQLQSWLQ
jgi:hypothetical protein